MLLQGVKQTDILHPRTATCFEAYACTSAPPRKCKDIYLESPFCCLWARLANGAIPPVLGCSVGLRLLVFPFCVCVGSSSLSSVPPVRKEPTGESMRNFRAHGQGFGVAGSAPRVLAPWDSCVEGTCAGATGGGPYGSTSVGASAIFSSGTGFFGRSWFFFLIGFGLGCFFFQIAKTADI